MFKDITKQELNERLAKFCSAMDAAYPDWDTALIFSNVNQYYFTGTMQDGMLVIKKDRSINYFVRRSFERAVNESPLNCVYEMNSYRDAVQVIGADCGNTYLETEIVALAIMERLKKYFTIGKINSLDNVILSVRAVKSPYELEWMERSGAQHHELLIKIVPSLLREGMSEVEFAAEIYEKALKLGHHGVSRFSMFQTEIIIGQIGFGESSIYPASFNGPGGAYGMSAAVPIIGSRERKLKKGDLVFVDAGYGLNGYHSDKTQVYMFGGQPDGETAKAHRACMEIQERLAERLRPGSIPSEIYHSVMGSLDDAFLRNFMGFGKRQVKFLGHGVGLHIDEMPVIAKGFDSPLEENMVLALEPKKGLADLGMVGVEDTYVVTPDGGRCITGGGCDIIVV